MITVNYICDRCGTYFDADDIIQVDINSIDDEHTRFNRVYDLCPECANNLINQFMKKEGCDDPTNN